MGSKFKWQDACGVVGVILAVAGMSDMPITLRVICFAACAVCLPISFLSNRTWIPLVRWASSIAAVLLMAYVGWNAWRASRPRVVKNVYIVWTQPSPVEAGTSLSASQLNAVAKFDGEEVQGRYVYNPTFGSTLQSGMDTLSVEFVPNDLSQYNASRQTIVILVKGAMIPKENDSRTKRSAGIRSNQRNGIRQNGSGNQANPVIVYGKQTTNGADSPIVNGSNTTINSNPH